MAGKNTEGKVSVKVLKPFHTGIDKPVYYKPGGDNVELPEKVAQQAIKQGLAEAVK
ncbi:hypothetical protein [Maribellus mangrovi]|uniref:hypothetical protein n=1 Tax=Maribellus mangrovi TaxID=3133146 RepID=UPI0030EEF876